MPYNLITHFSRDEDRYCLMCFEKIKTDNLHSFLHKDICICPKCLHELETIHKNEIVCGVKGEYLYRYSDKMKEKIYTLKGCYDIELAKAFISYFKFGLQQKYRGYFLVPSPSYKDSDTKRGFNHVVEIFKSLNLPYLNVIKKKCDYKQSDLNKSEREKVKEKLELVNASQLYNKKILFVDDISTTGSTLRACLDLIKSAHPKKVNFLIIAKVDDIGKTND